jgi:5-methylcytosine-specific restriction protein A
MLTAATQVDHVIALVNGGADDDSNRQSLCDDCHKAKTRDDVRIRDGKAALPIIGVDGYPIDDSE